MSPKPHQLEPVPERYRHLIEGHGKSPWHPSAKATARVSDPLPAPEVCPYCASPVEIRHHTEVYRGTYGDWHWLYACTGCDATVGMHPFTSIPLGTLAGPELRRTRTQCKQPFELLWRERMMTRTEAYTRLAEHLGIEPQQCHFGLFDADTCRAARDWSVAALRRHATAG